MKSIRALGALAFQADMVLKRGRNIRRINLFAVTEFDIPFATEAEVVRDAVVATGYDRTVVGLHRLNDDGPKSFLGQGDRLFRPLMTNTNERSLPLEQYLTHLVQAPNINHRSIFDPMNWANDPASISGTEHYRAILDDTFHDQDKTEGRLLWSNKAAAAAIHQDVCSRCLLAVGDEIYYRVRPPTWMVAETKHFEGMGGSVMVDTDHNDADLSHFRLDKPHLAERLSQKRWGAARRLGEIVHDDDRFLGINELPWLLFASSKAIETKGKKLVSYWPDEAVDAYRGICLVRRRPAALRKFGAADPASVLSMIEIVRRHVSDRTLPPQLLNASADIGTGIDHLLERLTLDPSLRLLLDAEDIMPLAELGTAL